MTQLIFVYVVTGYNVHSLFDSLSIALFGICKVNEILQAIKEMLFEWNCWWSTTNIT